MKIKDLFSTKERWTQKTIARDENGKWVNYSDATASCWCLLGAAQKCYIYNISEIISKIESEVGPRIAKWNDDENRIFEEVKALCEKLDI